MAKQQTKAELIEKNLELFDEIDNKDKDIDMLKKEIEKWQAKLHNEQNLKGEKNNFSVNLIKFLEKSNFNVNFMEVKENKEAKEYNSPSRGTYQQRQVKEIEITLKIEPKREEY